MTCSFFVSAPLGHTLMSLLQRSFAGAKPSTKTKILQILVSQLLLTPIQNTGPLLHFDDIMRVPKG
jgi:peroxisomal membrane protein 2